MNQPRHTLEANTHLSHYRIVAALGAGAMGEVYLAEDIRLKRSVAITVLPSSLTADSERVRRFEQEAQAARVQHLEHALKVEARTRMAAGRAY